LRTSVGGAVRVTVDVDCVEWLLRLRTSVGGAVRVFVDVDFLPPGFEELLVVVVAGGRRLPSE
jgi:hypothetical protein